MKALLVTSLIFAAIVSYSPATVFASTSLADSSQIRFEWIGGDEALSIGTVYSIIQDLDGFIWFGTENGLLKHDGYTLETYNSSTGDPTTISDDSVRALMIDSQNRFWVGTDRGLNLFDPESGAFSVLDLSPSGNKEVVFALSEDSSSNIWIGTGGGLYRLSVEGEVTSFDVSTTANTSLKRVRAVFEDSKGRIWIGTERDGVFLLNQNDLVVPFTKTADSKPLLIGAYIRDFTEGLDGRIWIATYSSGVTRIEGDISSSQTFLAGSIGSSSKLANRSRKLLKDSSGKIWIATDDGLYGWREEAGGFDRYSHIPGDRNSLVSNFIISLYEDSGGVVWVGTVKGVSKFNRRVGTIARFDLLSAGRSNKTSQTVSAFAEGPSGDVWIGTYHGLWKWARQNGQLNYLPPGALGLSDTRIGSLVADKDALLVGTVSSGIDALIEDKVAFNVVHDPYFETSLSNNAITDLYIDSKQRLWVSTYGGGLNLRIGEKEFKRYPVSENIQGQFSEMKIVDLVEDIYGRFWIATESGGVMILDADSGDIEILRHKPVGEKGLLSDRVRSLLANKSGVWLGTAKGLNFYNFSDEDTSAYTKEDNLDSDIIFSILEDGRGRIWLGTAKGLSVLDPSSGVITNYNSTHGLQEGDFNGGAALKLSDGSMLFGGNNGFNAFHPDQVKQNTHIPPVRITRFEIGNKKAELNSYRNDDGVLELQHNDRVIGFQFAALDYTAPERNQYRYKLEGFDDDWIDNGRDRDVTYTNLYPGSYVFRVQGSNNDGYWNEEGVSVPFLIRPAPWANIWAYSLYALAGLLAFWGILHLNNRRLGEIAENLHSRRVKLYLSALDEASESVLVADRRGIVTFANHTTNQILGKTPAELIRMSMYSILFQRESDAIAAREQIKEKGEFHGEVSYEHEDGEVSTLEVTINSAQPKERDAAFVGITRDVTERRKSEEESSEYRRTLEKLVLERTEQLEKEIKDSETIRSKLATSLAEKETLLKEVHHRVHNNLQVITSLLSIQADKAGEGDVTNALDESQERIKSMALIHENLYLSQNLKHIDLDDYVDALTTSLTRNHGVDGLVVHIEKEIDNVDLDVERAVPCGLIINELVTNALKHAFPEKQGTANITIRFVREGSDYVLSVSDDGVGLPGGFKIETNSSIGMEIVSILAEQLDGTFKFIVDRGATFQISFPAEA